MKYKANIKVRTKSCSHPRVVHLLGDLYKCQSCGKAVSFTHDWIVGEGDM